MPLARRSSVVVMKFSAPISDAMQKIAMLVIHRSAPSPSPGPATATRSAADILSSRAAARRPVTKKAARITMKATNVVQNDSMFRTGNAMSGAPI